MTLRGWNENEWRTRVFQFQFSVLLRFFVGCTIFFFYFSSVTCWCEKHNFSIFHPLHILTSQQRALAYKKSFLLHPPATHNQAPLDNRAQLTRNCFSPHSIPSRPKVTPLVKQRKMEKFFSLRKRLSMLLSLCASRAQILMTLTLNENEVTINYIKYDISYPLFSCFLFGASRSAHQVYLNVIGKTLLHASQP